MSIEHEARLLLTYLSRVLSPLGPGTAVLYRPYCLL